jgi:hypothetical protein
MALRMMHMACGVITWPSHMALAVMCEACGVMAGGGMHVV